MKPLITHCNLALGLQLNAAGEVWVAEQEMGMPNSTLSAREELVLA